MFLEVAGLSSQRPPEAIRRHMALNPTTTTELYDFNDQSHGT